jgi:hypothetical protein
MVSLLPDACRKIGALYCAGTFLPHVLEKIRGSVYSQNCAVHVLGKIFDSGSAGNFLYLLAIWIDGDYLVNLFA